MRKVKIYSKNTMEKGIHTHHHDTATAKTSLGFSVHSLTSAQAKDMRSLGIQWVRSDFYWAAIQPTKNQFVWGMDSFVKTAIDNGLQVLGIVDYSTPWNSTCKGGNCLPPDPVSYAAYAKALAAHYGPLGVHTWEIWNEENGPGQSAKADPVAYTKMLILAYTAIKEADPGAIVIMGGLQPAPSNGVLFSPCDFLTAVYANGGKGSFDAIAMHPYTYPVLPNDVQLWNAWSQMSQTSVNLRGIMTKNGDEGKQIWLTEYGAPTGGPSGVTEALQAAMYQQAITNVKTYPWAGPLFFYEYQDQGTDITDSENFFGVLTASGVQKAAYVALVQK